MKSKNLNTSSTSQFNASSKHTSLDSLLAESEALFAKPRPAGKLKRKAVPRPHIPINLKVQGDTKNWKCTAEIITRHVSTCACGRQYTTPANATRLFKYSNLRKPNTFVILEATHPQRNLPLEVEEIKSNVAICEECFGMEI